MATKRACPMCGEPLSRLDREICTSCRELLRGLVYCARCDHLLDLVGVELCSYCVVELKAEVLAGWSLAALVAEPRGRLPISDADPDQLGGFIGCVLQTRSVRSVLGRLGRVKGGLAA